MWKKHTENIILSLLNYLLFPNHKDNPKASGCDTKSSESYGDVLSGEWHNSDAVHLSGINSYRW